MAKGAWLLSNYTTEIRFICESLAGYDISQGYSKVDDIIKLAYPKIFDFDFPIFDEDYKETLCCKILRHYYTREICEEAYGLWKLRLETKMNEIMPYYNQLYLSEKLVFDPMKDTETTTEHHGTNSGESVHRNLYSDTPQGSLEGVETETYLTTASKDLSEGSGKDDYTTKFSGKTSRTSYSKMLEEYRKTFLNIDLQVIDELKSLFFGLW